MSPEVKEALACSDGKCGHHPQFDCDKHHPNPVLAAALREALEFAQRDIELNNRSAAIGTIRAALSKKEGV